MGDDVAFTLTHMGLCATLKHTPGQYLLVLYFGSLGLENVVEWMGHNNRIVVVYRFSDYSRLRE